MAASPESSTDTSSGFRSKVLRTRKKITTSLKKVVPTSEEAKEHVAGTVSRPPRRESVDSVSRAVEGRVSGGPAPADTSAVNRPPTPGPTWLSRQPRK
jgi:hypothetical protein